MCFPFLRRRGEACLSAPPLEPAGLDQHDDVRTHDRHREHKAEQIRLLRHEFVHTATPCRIAHGAPAARRRCLRRSCPWVSRPPPLSRGSSRRRRPLARCLTTRSRRHRTRWYVRPVAPARRADRPQGPVRCEGRRMLVASAGPPGLPNPPAAGPGGRGSSCLLLHRPQGVVTWRSPGSRSRSPSSRACRRTSARRPAAGSGSRGNRRVPTRPPRAAA